MAFELLIPKPDNTSISIELSFGQTLFVLGPNGTGKSRIMQRFYSLYLNQAIRISAHRQNWFYSSAVSITAADRINQLNNIRSVDSGASSVWSEYEPETRIKLAIYDLVAAQNDRARKIAEAVDSDDLIKAKALSLEQEPPLTTINQLLKLSNLPIVIIITMEGQILASKSGGPAYGINQLSDGERNVLILIASTLTAKQESLILIDEPERHIHHSISSPLLTLLIAKRPDCAFVISTHDIMLPTENKESNTLLLRNCNFNEQEVGSWDADILLANTELDEQIKEEILGSRRKILFIEGTNQSLDLPLYSLIFPDVSIVPKKSCRDVEHSVNVIRQEANTHWVKAFGIIDNDARTLENINHLKTQGIYALPFYSVESLYYHPEIQRRIATRQATIIGGTDVEYFNAAQAAALQSIQPQQVTHLAKRVAEKAVREEMFKNLPNKTTMQRGTAIAVNIDVAAFIQEEENRLNALLAAQDFLSILKRYPIRETGALGTIANALQFPARGNYESAVTKLLMDDNETLNFIRSLFDALPTDI